MTLFISVVLPAPLRPTRPAMVPAGSSSETSAESGPPGSTREVLEPKHGATHQRHSASPPDPRADLRRRVGDDATVVEREHRCAKRLTTSMSCSTKRTVAPSARTAVSTISMMPNFSRPTRRWWAHPAAGCAAWRPSSAQCPGACACRREGLAHSCRADRRGESIENSIGHLFGRRIVARHLGRPREKYRRARRCAARRRARPSCSRAR